MNCYIYYGHWMCMWTNIYFDSRLSSHCINVDMTQSTDSSQSQHPGVGHKGCGQIKVDHIFFKLLYF